MSGSSRSASVNSWGIVLGAFFAALALAPDAAEATCGDYVMVRGRHHGPGMQSASPDRSSTEADRTEAPLSPRVPICHGPNCSNDSVPPAAPAPKVESTLERWVCSLSTDLADPPQCSSLFAEPDVILAQGAGLSILRPPR